MNDNQRVIKAMGQLADVGIYVSIEGAALTVDKVLVGHYPTMNGLATVLTGIVVGYVLGAKSNQSTIG